MRAGEVRDELVKGLAGVAEGDLVRGDGWTVRFVPADAAHVGAVEVPVLFLEVEGAQEDEAAGFLRRRTMRGGG